MRGLDPRSTGPQRARRCLLPRLDGLQLCRLPRSGEGEGEGEAGAGAGAEAEAEAEAVAEAEAEAVAAAVAVAVAVCTMHIFPVCTVHIFSVCTMHIFPVCTMHIFPVCTIHIFPVFQMHKGSLWGHLGVTSGSLFQDFFGVVQECSQEVWASSKGLPARFQGCFGTLFFRLFSDLLR